MVRGVAEDLAAAEAASPANPFDLIEADLVLGVVASAKFKAAALRTAPFVALSSPGSGSGPS